MIMLMPLVFHGAGKLSLDRLLKTFTGRAGDDRKVGDFAALGLGLIILGTPLIYMFPVLGTIVLLGGIGSIAAHRFL